MIFTVIPLFLIKSKRNPHPFILKFWSLATSVVVSKLLRRGFLGISQALALLAEGKRALPDRVAHPILGICDNGLEKSPEEERETRLCLKLLAVSL